MYLLATTLLGGLYLVILFGMCLGGVVGIKALNREMRRREKDAKQDKEPENEAERPAEKKGEPKQKTQKIYYIVEKKRTKTKSSYGEPKEIKFEK